MCYDERKTQKENRGKRKRSGEAAVRLIAAEEEEKEEMDAIYLDNDRMIPLILVFPVRRLSVFFL